MIDHIPHEPAEFLKWIIGFFIVLWIIWFFTGGPERTENKYKPFIEPLVDSTHPGQTYGTKP